MKPSKAVIWLSGLIATLALLAAGVGLFYRDGGSPFSFVTLRGNSVPIRGQGLYHYDSPIVAVGFMAADAITLVLAIPLLVIATVLYRRGSLKGGLLLAGTLAYFLYNYVSVAFGAAYNNLFIIYVALMAASLFALILALTSFDLPALLTHFSTSLSRRGMGVFLIVSGVILSLVWLALSIVPALLAGTVPPEVGAGTTFMTGVVDEGIAAPALIVSGVLLLRRAPVGYLLTGMLLVFTDVLGANLLAGGIAQLATGVMGIGPFIGATLPFVVLTVIALWFTIAFFRHCSDAVTSEAARVQAAAASHSAS